MDSTFEKEKDHLCASISLSTIVNIELWVQKGRSSQMISEVSSHISLSNALFQQFGKNQINPLVGLIFTDIYSSDGQSNNTSENDIKKLIYQKLTQVRDNPYILFQKSENDKENYIDSLKDIANFISKKVAGVKYWPNMISLFNDTSESLKDVSSFNSLKNYSFNFANVWLNYRKERINAAEYNTKLKANELILKYINQINVETILINNGTFEIMPIVKQISNESMNVFYNYIDN